MNDFLLGILSGLVIEIIVTLIVHCVAKLKNSTLLKIIASSKLFGHGIEYVYKEQSNAMKDMMADIKKSTTVKLFCMRGRSFIQSDADLSEMIERRNLDMKYLVLDPNSDFAQKRAAELNKTNYIQELETNISDLISQTVGKSNVHKRKHDQPPVFRILILDNRAYPELFTAV